MNKKHVTFNTGFKLMRYCHHKHAKLLAMHVIEHVAYYRSEISV